MSFLLALNEFIELMKRFLLVIIIIYLLLSPFYVFQSGLPQPADIVIGFGAVVFIFHKGFRQTYKLSLVKYVLYLLAVIIIVNLIQWFYLYGLNGIENKLYFNPLFYIYNILFLIMNVYIVKQDNPKFNRYILMAILASLAIQTVLALFGIHGGAKDMDVISRPSLFFNNPNQLGYYALGMLTYFVIMPSRYNKIKWILILAIGLSTYLVLVSGSRAALGGILLLGGFKLYKESIPLSIGGVLVIVLMAMSVPFLIQTNFIQKKINLIESRDARNDNTKVTEIQVRGYDKIILNPEYLFFGAGEGKYSRFEGYSKTHEIHSGFGTILFCYGIFGFFLFCFFLYKVVEPNKIKGIIYLTPVLAYNLTHQGLRTPLFWVVLGIMGISLLMEQKNNQKLLSQNAILPKLDSSRN